MTSSPVPSDFARLRRVGAAATEALRELGGEVESWVSRPQDPAPAEVHEVARGLATALDRTWRIADALALQASREGDGAAAADAEAAARALEMAVGRIDAFGRSMADRHFELDAWADDVPIVND